MEIETNDKTYAIWVWKENITREYMAQYKRKGTGALDGLARYIVSAKI
jgi:hypothetical protein